MTVGGTGWVRAISSVCLPCMGPWSGVGHAGRAGFQQFSDSTERAPGDDGGVGVLQSDRFGVVFGIDAPEQRAGVDLVAQDDVEAGPGPEPAGGVGYALVVIQAKN